MAAAATVLTLYQPQPIQHFRAARFRVTSGIGFRFERDKYVCMMTLDALLGTMEWGHKSE